MLQTNKETLMQRNEVKFQIFNQAHILHEHSHDAMKASPPTLLATISSHAAFPMSNSLFMRRVVDGRYINALHY